MKLLVTGGLGFIGSNFILHVLKNYDDFEIINVDAELLGSNHENLTEVKNAPNYEFVKGNIINRKLMEDLISRSDAVINFAAESHVDRSIADADPFLKSNIRGTYTILDIIRNQKNVSCIYLLMRYLEALKMVLLLKLRNLIRPALMLQQRQQLNYW